MEGILKTLYVTNRYDWRKWLSEHHSSEQEIWLIYYKRHICKPRVSYDEAVEEALCYGWIDSIIRRIDENSYCQRFTPRRKGSKWSPSNISRVEELIKKGSMKEAGMIPYREALANPALLLDASPPALLVQPPPDLVKALKGKGRAYGLFIGFAPSYRKNAILWIEAAKRAETRSRRINEVVELAAKGEKIGLK
ncbi:MAG: hypothetical protein E4G95_03310 [Bacteroidia bacterium]|nr:MAG: hypothetical protein E4G95_03310 [Bacteroidia bacterium]